MIRHRYGALSALLAGCVGVFTISASSIIDAQDGTPSEATADRGFGMAFANQDGLPVGTAVFRTRGDTLTITVDVEELAPSDHSIRIHEIGICDPGGDEPFSSAGDSFNPAAATHGTPMTVAGSTPTAAATPGRAELHAGDLGTITIGDDGAGTSTISIEGVTVLPGASNSLADDNGSALVIHGDPDELMPDSSDSSSARIACSVIRPPVGGTPPPISVEWEQPLVQALDSLFWSDPTIIVPAGESISLTNAGFLEHDFVVDALGIDVDLPNGEVVEVQIPEDAAPGEYGFYCSVPGHAAAGMVGTLIIEPMR